MASFTLGFPAAAAGRVFAATATKSSGSGKEEKGPFDWILGGMQKEEQILLETDPILKKVEEKNGGRGTTTTNGKKNTVAVPPKKSGGFPNFGGLFAKK